MLAIAGSSAQFQPEISVEPMIRAVSAGKPLAAFLAPHAAVALARLAEGGVAGFRTPESCADAIRAWSEWSVPVEVPPADVDRVTALTEALSAVHGDRPNESESSSILGALGIPAAPSVVLPPDAASTSFASVRDYPVVAKILSRDVLHKTEAGGVVVGIQSADELAEAVDGILANVAERLPDAVVDGVLVQRMEKGLAEVILGFRRDPEVGPVVVLGVGGVLAELYKDFTVRMAPVGIEDARSMIEEVTGLAVVRGYRGLPLGDCKALAQAVVNLSQLAADPAESIAEAELNPLLVLPEGRGVVAVDALVVLGRKEQSP
ncbi:acetate--CoA ligase family protein [Blastococcus brunescens]|uniref:Acetate--CoA ligase family protein n=1 Tax=Blastococcus brunescens TaxID=1564165 RepID=A0ABZ1B5K8_9ACTN|nr:acetate--CoA ligase family protein [Blastococcus sp. BMG 8361]WRL65421.1 acetate--CoA ligase family protein [Blastococcus sp. BMG 8361]